MILSKYATALLQIAIVAVTAFVAIPDDQLNLPTLLQLAIQVVGAVVVFLVPLLDGPWRAGLKTGSAVVVAILTAVIPLAVQGGVLTKLQIAVVILAALNALATELGVSIRQTAALTGEHAAAAAISDANRAGGFPVR